MEKKYFVYTIKNLLEPNKIYVGLTKNPTTRWKRHKSTAKNINAQYRYYLHNSMHAHGIENFSFEVIESFSTLDEVRVAEKRWVAHFKNNNFHLYNLTEGGETHPECDWTDEQRKAASERNSGEKNYFYGKQLFGESNGNYGKKMKPHVKKILLQHRAKLTPEQVQEIRDLYATGNYTQAYLCRKYDMSCAQIHRIVKWKRWH